MSRIMAIDYGLKRVGLAVTDPLKMIATSIGTIHSKDVLTFIENYIKKEAVECIVIGEPKKMNNSPSEISSHIEVFIKHLKKKFPQVNIDRMDERFTSKMAFQTILASGIKKKERQNKELVDTISATIILQSYLEYIKNKI